MLRIILEVQGLQCATQRGSFVLAKTNLIGSVKKYPLSRTNPKVGDAFQINLNARSGSQNTTIVAVELRCSDKVAHAEQQLDVLTGTGVSWRHPVK